jgi:FkbM family methyltransferase
MKTSIARRAVSDILAVSRCALPLSTLQWTGSLLVHLPECIRSSSLAPADRRWASTGARFRTSTGAVVSLPAAYTAGAREMYCRNVYLRSGMTMPAAGWVVDLGANHGLFSVWAALTGAQVVAVEAQAGFASEIRALARYNGVADQVHVKIGLAGGLVLSGARVGVVADEHRWATTSHGAASRPADVPLPQLMADYDIGRIGLLKMDIEGGEFAVFGTEENLDWLGQVDQLVLELHRDFGDTLSLVDRLRSQGFTVDLRDNDGHRVAAGSASADYAYCQR